MVAGFEPGAEVLATERTLLRRLCEADADAMYALNRDPEVVRWTGDAPFSSVAAAAEFLRAYDPYSRDGMGRWAVVLRESGEVAGFAGLRRCDDGEIDLGYRFHRRLWGQGLATETAAACLDHGFGPLGLERIIGRSAIGNLGSIRVLDKLGMRFERHAVDHDHDIAIYAISRDAWLARGR